MLLDKKRILGIDPGLETTGISILELDYTKTHNVLLCDVISTSKKKSLSERLYEIFEKTNSVINNFKPFFASVEELFFNSNAKSVINVGQARGIIMLSAHINKLEISEYTPLQIKQAITGYGRATKDQIKYMTAAILKIDENSLSLKDDAWDSLAIALCHANSLKFNSVLKKYDCK